MLKSILLTPTSPLRPLRGVLALSPIAIFRECSNNTPSFPHRLTEIRWPQSVRELMISGAQNNFPRSIDMNSSCEVWNQLLHCARANKTHRSGGQMPDWQDSLHVVVPFLLYNLAPVRNFLNLVDYKDCAFPVVAPFKASHRFPAVWNPTVFDAGTLSAE